MNTHNTHIDVALILWNTDVIDLVSLTLHHRNVGSNGIEPSQGVERIEEVIVAWSPSVVVFDLAPPYDRSAEVALQLLDRFPDCSFVMTCADSARAQRAAPWLSCHPVFQKPYRLDAIANTIRSMVERSYRSSAAMASIGM
jgi:hypothetical protein